MSVSGGKVWYRIVGAAKPGIPLLTLHGGPGGAHDYLEPMEALAGDRPVIFYDQLGCGNSDRPDDRSLWTVERFVDELAQIRPALGLEQVHFLGQSWGSMLAVDYLLTGNPTGVVSLVMSGPCLSASRWAWDQRAHIAALPEPVRKTIEVCEAAGRFDAREYQDASHEHHIEQAERYAQAVREFLRRAEKKQCAVTSSP